MVPYIPLDEAVQFGGHLPDVLGPTRKEVAAMEDIFRYNLQFDPGRMSVRGCIDIVESAMEKAVERANFEFQTRIRKMLEEHSRMEKPKYTMEKPKYTMEKHKYTGVPGYFCHDEYSVYADPATLAVDGESWSSQRPVKYTGKVERRQPPDKPEAKKQKSDYEELWDRITLWLSDIKLEI